MAPLKHHLANKVASGNLGCIFFNIKWRWGFSAHGKIVNLESFCPTCHVQIFPIDVSSYESAPQILFVCDSCDKKLWESQETKEYIQEEVIGLIRKRTSIFTDKLM